MPEQKIPKKIHYCWLSNDSLPKEISDCIDTWKRILPDYEIVKWNSNNFDLDSVRFVKQAFEKRKWAFASDYIRLYAVHNEGGIYFDSDVKVMKSLDKFLHNEMFIPVEYHPRIVKRYQTKKMLDERYLPRDRDQEVTGIGLQAAIFGGRQGHPFLKSCMEFYEDKDFINPDGSLFMDLIAPSIYAKVATDFGFVYDDQPQMLKDDIAIIESKYFAPTEDLATREAVAIHCCAGSWRDLPKQTPWTRAMSSLKRKVRNLSGI